MTDVFISYKREDKASARALADGSPCDFCPETVVIPAGTFTMGSPPEEEARYD